MFRIQKTYMQMCYQSDSVHELTVEEQTELQAHLRKMYKEIEQVCIRHNLRMMLGYGSVLGAVRHHGFIPWDDDLDLLMPREDYDLLINEYADELPGKYIIYAPNSKYGAIYQFAKVVDKDTIFIMPGQEYLSYHRGVYIDIFPLEYYVENPVTRFVKQTLSHILIGISASVAQYESKSTIYKNILCGCAQGRFNYWVRQSIGFIFSMKSSKYWYNKLDNLLHSKEKSSYLHVPSGQYRWRPISDDIFLPARRTEFDDVDVFIPNKSEEYLTISYGDWHRIPNPDERWRHFLLEIKM